MVFRVKQEVRRSFLQTACGVLFAWMTAAVADPALRPAGWKLGLFTLLAAAVSAGVSAVAALQKHA